VASPLDWLVLLGALLFAVWGLRRNLSRAVLFIAPGTLLIDSEDPPDRMQVPAELATLARELERLGFSPIGSRREKPLFAGATTYYDYANAPQGVFATLFSSRSGQPHLYYLTATPGSGYVITASYRRPSREVPGVYLAGVLEGFPPERIYRAHLRRIEPLGSVGEYTQQSRLEVAKAWASGPGRSEIRQQNFQGLMWTAAILVFLVAAFFGAAPYVGRR